MGKLCLYVNRNYEQRLLQLRLQITVYAQRNKHVNQCGLSEVFSVSSYVILSDTSKFQNDNVSI